MSGKPSRKALLTYQRFCSGEKRKDIAADCGVSYSTISVRLRAVSDYIEHLPGCPQWVEPDWPEHDARWWSDEYSQLLNDYRLQRRKFFASQADRLLNDAVDVCPCCKQIIPQESAA